jgi:hypothetical protein
MTICLLFVLIFVSGVLLSKWGKPYSFFLLTAHKLISIAAAAVLILILYRSHQAQGLNTTELTASVVTGTLFLITVASGGLLSSGNPMPSGVWTMHEVMPVATALFSGLTLYMLRVG